MLHNYHRRFNLVEARIYFQAINSNNILKYAQKNLPFKRRVYDSCIVALFFAF